VLEGHLECLSIGFVRRPGDAELLELLRSYRSLPQELNLPSAPAQPIILRDEPDRPQTRRDRDAGRGMSTVVGRVRPCPILDVKLVCLSHNTIRGAAGGSVLNAELMYAQGMLR
jgi:aspartate-semialdehyde dehydrogenase